MGVRLELSVMPEVSNDFFFRTERRFILLARLTGPLESSVASWRNL